MAAALPALAIAATIGSTAVSAYGAMRTAQANSAAASAKAQQDQNNAILAQNSANDAVARGQVAAQQKANQTNQLIGQQRASLAANGVDPNAGTAVDLQSDAAGNGELDQLTIQGNAAREAAGYQAQGANYSSQASVDEASSQNALSAGALSTVGSVLGGAGSVAGQWYQYQYGTRKSAV